MKAGAAHGDPQGPPKQQGRAGPGLLPHDTALLPGANGHLLDLHLVDRLERGKDLRGNPASDDDPEGREARLTWRIEGREPNTARILVDLHTGLPHQIRAQLALAAHPILSDVKYGGPRARRIALHALRLAFPHPVGGAVMAVHAAVPDDLVRLDRDLGILPPASGSRPPTGRPGAPSP